METKNNNEPLVVIPLKLANEVLDYLVKTEPVVLLAARLQNAKLLQDVLASLAKESEEQSPDTPKE